MDSSSIVSFNNDSTYQTTLKGDYNNVSVHELALHAMRDRCLLLQRRINTLENDNMKLKLDISKVNVPYLPLQDDENSHLHQKIAELNKQKSQLINHVFMVSCENKNLWNKISTLKSQDKFGKEISKHPLIRTNTYNTPKGSANYQEKYSEPSLEEISLKLINSFIQEKSQLVEQYEQMTQLRDVMDDDILNVDSIGFTYMEDSAFDSLKEIHNQTEKLQKLKKELVQQENDLKLVISKLESVLLEGFKCPTCISNNSRTMSTENKEVETSGSLLNLTTPMQSTNFNNFDESNSSVGQNNLENDMDTIEHYNKICPMCGQTFKKTVDFSEFQSHVEQHFIGENEIDSLTDNIDNTPNSFENVS